MGNKFIAVIGADQTANSGDLAAALQATTSASRLYSVTVFNTKVTPQFIQLHDSASGPGNGSTPKICFAIAGSEAASIDFSDGRIFANGIHIANSTTGDVLTAGATDCIIDCTYRKT